jgi:hypothetical protein
VLAHHSFSGDDATLEAGTQIHSVRTGLTAGIDDAFESGSYVPDPGHARQFNVWGQIQKANYNSLFDYEDVTPSYNPIDGYTQIADTRGFIYSYNVNGSTPGIKRYSLSLGADRFFDDSGAIHQADALATFSARFKNQLSFTLGPHVGELRSYALSAPGPIGCGDPALPRSAFSGFPHYYCGQTDPFNQLTFDLGYRDGTPAPVDFASSQGPFGGTFLHQYSLTTSRQLGTKLSIAAEYAGTFGRTIANGQLDSQWLRTVSLGDNLGPDSNVALELRSINGVVNGLTTVPGVNLALSFHRKFTGGNELYVAYGTPAATQTLNRFILKYVYHLGTLD